MLDSLTKNTLAPLLLRLGLATIFLFHGIDKVQQGGGTSWDQRPESLQLPMIVQFLVAWGELIGGLAVALGLLTRLAAAGLAFIMLGAIVTVHGEKGFSLREGGFEYTFALLVICLALILMGPGSFALDRFIRLRRRTAP